MPTSEELSAALEKAEAERDELATKVEKLEKKLAKKEKAEEKPEPIDKAELDPRVREALEKAEAQAKAAEERIAKAEDLAKAERDARIEKEFIAKAESEFKHVGGNASEFGPVLKAMSETLPEEIFKAVETRLKAAEAQVSQSNLYKEMGVGGDPAPGAAGEADLSSLTQKAEELKKAQSGLSDYEALHLAMVQDREAQARYLASVR